MPIVLAALLRTVIIAIASAIPVTIAENVLDGTIKKLVREVQDETGETEETAKEIIGDILLDLAANSVVIGIVVKGKIAVKAAEYLGLTAKGFKRAKLSAKAAAAVAKVAGPWEKFKAFSLISKILTLAGLAGAGVWTANMFVQAVEPGIYKPKEANNLWQRFIGIRPFPEADTSKSPPPFSESQFTDFLTALESAGVIGINNPFTRQTLAYSRSAASDLVFAAYGDAILKGQPTTLTKFQPTLGQYFILRTGTTPAAPHTTNETPATQSATVAAASFVITPTQETKVWSGIISQGVLGSPSGFTPRPDDLIVSASELETAARNNLASFLAAIPGRLVYEIKLVPQITTKDGYITRGGVQRIQTGTTKSGKATYKTVTNKFAVANVYVLTATGSRTKLSSITLGPVDAVSFQPALPDLQKLETTLKNTIATNNTSEIQAIVTPSPPAIITAPANQAAAAVVVSTQPIVTPPASPPAQSATVAAASSPAATAPAAPSAASVALEQARQRLAAGGTTPEAVPASTNPNRCSAQTIATFYDAAGVKYPSVSERSKLYESYGLGPAAWYTGTAEQNARLLTALKSRVGCPI